MLENSTMPHTSKVRATQRGRRKLENEADRKVNIQYYESMSDIRELSGAKTDSDAMAFVREMSEKYFSYKLAEKRRGK